MSEERIIPKKSSVPGRLPSPELLEVGELAINIGDQKLFSKNGLGDVFEIGGQGFKTAVVGENSLSATINSGALTIQAGLNIEVEGNTASSTVIISSPGSDMGFTNKAQSTITFNSTTRTFTIAPVAGYEYFEFWNQGKRFRKYEAESVTIPDTSGVYWFYYDNGGVLNYKVALFTVFSQETSVSYIYWNSTQSAAVIFADERHGVEMDWATHEYLHRTRGTVMASGLAASNYTTAGDGSSNAHAQISFTNGTYFDEDIKISVTHSATPTQPFEQFLSPYAKIPLLYRSGTTGEWAKINATDYPVHFGTSRIQYNYNNGTQWVLSDIPDKKFLAMWIVATNNVYEPIIAIVGQRYDDNQTQAINNAQWENLSLEGLPLVEFRQVCRVIFEADNAFTNSIDAAIRYVTDLRELPGTSTISGGGTGVNDHGELLGLSDDDHSQYVHISTARTISATHTFSPGVAGPAFNLGTNANNQLIIGLNADKLDGLESNQFLRSDTNGTLTGNLNITGVLSLSNTGVISALNLNNNDIVGINKLSFNDPGPNEGIEWAGGNLWKIYESPNDLTTNSSGNLQFVQNATRRFTIATDGEIYVGTSKVWHQGNDGAGSGLDADTLDSFDSSYFTNATNISTGTVNTARLGGGTANSDTVLYGNNTWAPLPSSTGTNLSYSANSTTVTVASDSGLDAIIPSANATVAGVLTVADKTKLDGIATGAQPGTVTSITAGSGLSGGTITVSNTIAVVANSGIVANSTGVFVNANSGLVANSTGLFVNASSIAQGTVPTARLGSGTANSSTFLAGDQTYKSAVTQLVLGNGMSGSGTNITTTGSIAVVANTGLIANSTGLFVNANTGLVANSTGLFVNASAVSVGTLGTAYGGTGLTTFTDRGILFASNTTTLATSANLVFTTTGLGIGTSSPGQKLDINLGSIQLSEGYDVRWGTFSAGSTGTVIAGGSSQQLVMYTSGTERFRITANGNIGVSGAPSNWTGNFRAIEIQGTSFAANGPNNLIISTNVAAGVDGGGAGGTYNASAAATKYQQISGVHRWFTATSGTAGGAIDFGAAKMLLDNTGSLGIGVATPAEKLDVLGGIKTTSYWLLSGSPGGAGGTNRYIGGAGVSDSWYYNVPTGGSQYWAINESTVMRLNQSGNLGIGTSSPSYRAHIAYDQAMTLGVFRDVDVTSVGAAAAYIDIGARSGTTFTPGSRIASVLNNPSTTGYIQFETRSGNALVERMRITSGGDVGIGTSSPTNTLTVQGTVAYNLLGTTDVWKYFTGGSGLVYAGTTTGTSIGFISGGGERLRLSSTGNFGVNTTAPGTKLDVAGTMRHQISTSWAYYPGVTSFVLDADGAGGYVIQTPFSLSDQFEMGIAHVKGYGYGDQTLYDFKVVFYAYSSITSYSMVDSGNDGQPKFIGLNSSGKICIAFGDLAELTNYFYRFVVDFYATRYADSYNYSTGWSFTQTTSANYGLTPIYQLSAPVTQLLAGGAIIPGGIYGSNSGSPDVPIWMVSRQYPNWGMFYNEGSPDYIEFKSGGTVTSRISLDNGDAHFGLNGGNVGIGTTVSTEKFGANYKNLSISGSSGATVSLEAGGQPRMLLTADGAASYISAYDDNPIIFSVTAGNFTTSTGTERMRLDASGNLGIGTNAPGSKLDVVGNVRAGASDTLMGTHPSYSGYSAWWRFGNDYNLLTEGTNTFLNAPNNTGNIYFRKGNSTTAMIDGNTGYLGVGTVTPRAALHIMTGVRSLSLAADGAGIGGASYFMLGNSDSGGTAGPNVIIGANRTLRFGVGDSFTSASGGTFTQYMALNSTGLGIGTEPAYKLEVYQAANDATIRVQTGGAGAWFEARDTTAYYAGTRYVGNNGARYWLAGMSYGVQDYAIAMSSDGGTNRFFTINNSGNVLLSNNLEVAGDIEQGPNFAHPNVEWSAASTSTGQVIFYLPGSAGTTTYGMVHMVFDFYEYATNKIGTVIVGGHNWSSTQWYNVSCNVIGNMDKTVQVGIKDGKYVVVFGTAASTWSYGTIRLRKVHNGSYYNNLMDLSDWSVEQTSATISYTYLSGDLRQLRTSGDFYAPTMYDINNTAYYSNPAGTSVFDTIQVNNINITGTVSGNAASADKLNVFDTRLSATTPQTYDKQVRFDFKENATNGLADGGQYNSVMYWRKYGSTTDWSGGGAAEIAYTDNQRLWMRYGTSTTWGAWKRFIFGDDFDNGGIVKTSGSFRAPIFYDSNDTNYYVDPASTSVLTSLELWGTFVGRRTSGLTSIDLVTYNNYADMRVIRNNASTNNDGMYIGYANSNSGLTRIYGEGASTAPLVKHASYTYESGSFRAPIFYDSDDTNYYLDPTSISYINNIYIAGGVAGISNSSLYTEAAIEIRERGFGGAQDDTWATAPRLAFHWGGRAASQIGMDSSGRIHILNNPGNSNQALQSGNFYAPIFYDSDNTGFYVDPGNISNVSTFRMANMSPNNGVWHSTPEGTNRFFFANSGTTYYKTGSNFIFRNSGDGGIVTIDSSGNLRVATAGDNFASYNLHVGGTGFASVDFRAPIFYDSDDTAAYLNPAGNSVLHNITTRSGVWAGDLQGNTLLQAAYDYDGLFNVLQFKGAPTLYQWNGTTWLNSGTQSNLVDGRFAQNYGGTTLVNGRSEFVIDFGTVTGYTFPSALILKLSTQGSTCTVYFERATTSDTASPTAYTNSTPTGGASDGWTTLTSTSGVSTWPGTVVIKMSEQIGGSLQTRIRLRIVPTTWHPSNAITIGQVGLMTSYGSPTRLFEWDYNRTVTFNNAVYAPVFYDSNNTSYYVDPAGAASMSLAGDITLRGEINWVNSGGHFMDVNGDFYLRYSDNSSFFNDRLSVFGSGNYTQATGSLRAPIFYDSDNTGFYTDPAGISNIVALKINTAGTGASTRALTLRAQGQSEIDFGSYPGNWNSAIQIQNNANDRMLWMAALDSASANIRIRAAGSGLDIYTDGTVSDGGTRSAAIGSGGIYTGTVYDLDDSNYYLNPNGSVALFSNGVVVAGTEGFQSRFYSGGVRNRIWSFYNADSYGLSYFQGAAGIASNDTIGFHFGSATAGNSFLQINAAGYTFASGSIRSPLFYDSDNTGYYADPAGDVSFRGYGELAISNYAVGNLQPGALNIGRTDTNYSWTGGTWASDVRLGILANCADNWEFAIHDSAERVASVVSFVGGPSNNFIEMGRDLGWGTTPILAANSFRAPIFYDSGNTAYYVDPLNGSVLGGQVSFAGGTYIATNGDVYARRSGGATGVYYFADGGSKYLYWDGSGYLFGSQGGVTSSVSMSAPIFYDSSNTSYYVDPAGTSNLSGLTVASSITGSITGNAATATSSTNALRIVYNDGPRDLSDRLPNSFTRTVNFDFVGAGTANGTGNYGGVMTFSPWTGTTASTGDSSYQLAFANLSGVNASGQPKLSIRNGIDTTWNAWYTFLHSGNYNSYALPLSGGTMTGALTNNVSISSPIFYDSGNTARYVDPNGDSVLGSATFNQSATTTSFNIGNSGTAFTLNCKNSNVQRLTMSGSVAGGSWTITNVQDGQTINLFITQQSSGYTLGWPSSFKWAGGQAPTISAVVGAVDLLVMTYIGATSHWYCSLLKDMK